MDTKNIYIGSYDNIIDKTDVEVGNVAYDNTTQKMYVWTNDNVWQEISTENSGLNMNLYELNKNIISQLEPLTDFDLENWYDELIAYKTNRWKHKHFMLLCRDYNYYTLFEEKEKTNVSFGSVVLEIIKDIGPIYSIEINEDDVIEIWIKPVGEESPLAFYLFPYENGVVYYG